MPVQDILSAIFTFSLGLLAKFIYDIWSDQRKRKSLLFVKSTLADFTISNLDEDLRKQILVLYENHQIQSISRVRLEVENNGVIAVKNQAVTVRFSEKAQIIGEPREVATSEDHRHAALDVHEVMRNSRRFLLHYLRHNHRLAWDFTVINHDSNDFLVEHGIIVTQDGSKDDDLDVSSTVTSERAQIDLAGRISKIVRLFVYIAIITLLRNILSIRSLGYWGVAVNDTVLLDAVNLVTNLALIAIWLMILRDIASVMLPLLTWLRPHDLGTSVAGDLIHATIGEGAYNVAIGKDIEQADVRADPQLLEKVTTEMMAKTSTSASEVGS